jgi:hypothetical protein
MPTKTDRILSYLPPTFQTLSKPPALYALADAFGNELLQAENSLAALLLAHWVDHADRNAELIQDLGCIAALYGLAPRGAAPLAGNYSTCPPLPAEESVEEFREHLKRYVRTFLDGTATVQGILRVTAEALGLHIADEPAALDAWWLYRDPARLSREPSGDDAARLLLGTDSLVVSGEAARAAAISGSVDLGAGVDLRGAARLRIQVDAAPAMAIDLATAGPDPAALTLDEIRQAINTAVALPIAGHDGRTLTLHSPTVGPASRLEIEDIPEDAAPRLLGLRPRRYGGTTSTAAQVIGRVDLTGGVDLRTTRYLRLLVDGNRLAEVDCAALAADPAHASLAEIRQAIDAALGLNVATDDGQHLILTSPTTGSGSSLTLLAAAAQDAREALFGPLESFYAAGRDARPAEAVGVNDLSQGVDLSARSRVRLRLDSRMPITVDCAGADPAHTLLSEIVAALTSNLGLGIASHDGRFLRLVSPTAGPAGALSFEPLPAELDATEILFGIGPRQFTGTAASAARLVGAPDLSTGVDLGALHRLQITLDGGPAVEIDVRRGAVNSRAVTLAELEAAINTALGAGVASDDGRHLILSSLTSGADSRMAVEPLEMTRRRYFVTRAFITDDAAQTLFGFYTREAQGTAATSAQIVGTVDLSRGVDLREVRFLRLAIAAGPAVDIDCAGVRPRATLLDEIVAAINSRLGLTVAGHDGRHLVLTSPGSGAASRIAFEPPRAADALTVLFGLPPTAVSGRNATGVRFVGTVDLSAGIDLSAASHIRLGIDSASAVEIDCAKAGDPAHTRLNDIVLAINLALGSTIVQHDGTHLVLTSPSKGATSRIEFAALAGPDATGALFGVSPPRLYHGSAAAPAQVSGSVDLAGEIDLSIARFLRLAVNGGQPLDIDCTVSAADPQKVSPDQIVQAINAACSAAQIPAVAARQGQRLTLTTTILGAAARLDLLPYTGGDARPPLFGEVPAVTTGTDPAPAVITGEVDLLQPVDVTEQPWLRLAVDGGRAVAVNIAGAAPGATLLDEIVTRINAILPNLAVATEDNRLRLTSPTHGEISRLVIFPWRALEVLDYPPQATAAPPDSQLARQVRHGDRWQVNQEGASAADLTIALNAPQGAAGPAFVNRAAGGLLRLAVVIPAGGGAEVQRILEGQLQAALILPDGTHVPLAESQLLLRPLVPPAEFDSTALLVLPRGRSSWAYADCAGARFNQATFSSRVQAQRSETRFAGGVCLERGLFNVSRFSSRAQPPAGQEATVFATAVPGADPPVELRFRWDQHQPGAFEVNLPADLSERFGGRFNQARFARSGDQPEEFKDVVTEPASDPDYLVTRLTGSNLVKAAPVERVPLGFTAVTLPFRHSQPLGGGTDDRPARLYLAEEDVPGFIELSAVQPGAWGNAIAVAARKAGPARFDITLSYQGARFENARRVVLGGEELPALTEDLLRPGPVGILQAKAAGIAAAVTREHTRSEP